MPLILAGTLCLLAAQAATHEASRADDATRAGPPLALRLNAEKAEDLTLQLLPIDFPLFKIKAGKKLKLKALHLDPAAIGYAISASTSGVLRNTDLPQLGEITGALNSQDADHFLAALAHLSQRRRQAKSPEEQAEVQRLQEKKARKGGWKYGETWAGKWMKDGWSIFGSGLVEVSGDSPAERYLVPLSDFTSENFAVDLKALKLDVLRDLSVYVTRKLMQDAPSSDPRLAAMTAMAKSLESPCSQGACAFTEQKSLGLLISDLFGILITGSRDKYSTDEKKTLDYRRRVCAFELIRQTCPGLGDLKAAEELARGIDCTKRSELSEGLTPLDSE
jgi:hypothetical protein